MHAHLLIVAAATLVGAPALAADHANVPALPSSQPQPPSSQVVLASADDIRQPSAPDQSTSPPSKRPRIARVTTCRCGDPQPQPER